MKYKYTVITLTGGGNHLQKHQIEDLKEWFDNGWEYVDTIQQNGYDYSAIAVVLKKLVEGEGLLP